MDCPSSTGPPRGRAGTCFIGCRRPSARANDALQYAIAQANQLKLPVLVGFGLMDRYPDANLRHHRFMLEGLAATSEALRGRGVQMAVLRGSPPDVALRMAEDAARVVCDRGYYGPSAPLARSGG